MTPHQYLTLPQSRAFMDAIAAQPADDLPRLVMADDIEEHGFGEVAAFIRISVNEPKKLNQSHITDRVMPFYMIPRVQALRFSNMDKTFLGVLSLKDTTTSQVLANQCPTVRIIRGFPEQIHCTSREATNDPCECQNPASIMYMDRSVQEEGYALIPCYLCGGTGTISSSVNRYAQFWPMSYITLQ